MTGWNFACADWEQRLREGRSLVPDLPLFKDKADRAVRIFDKLCVPDIEGQPPFAVAAGEWFRDIVRVIFGSLDDEGVRHVPEVFALVGKKNSKTTSGAGLMMTSLLMNEVPWAEFLFIGPTQEIADLAFQQAAGMVEADPDGYLVQAVPRRRPQEDHSRSGSARCNMMTLVADCAALQGDAVLVRAFRPRMVCTQCAIFGADARPKWRPTACIRANLFSRECD